MKTHEYYIRRCIQLAKNGLGTTYPNPMVGSVIVYKDKIIGEGWHKKSGENHAEVNAINSVKDKSLLRLSTIYVSLEPCNHFGKTPPCCDLIIKNNIPNVVVGSIDSFAKVSGNGIKRLIEAGKTVTVGILEEECKDLNKRFFSFHEKKRPYIILKWAETQDGFIAPKYKEKQEPIWITNSFSRQLVHKWRSEEQAILVGTKTVLDDNPKLDVRDWKGENPIRIVLDRTGKISKKYYVKDQTIKTIIITEQQNLPEFDNLHYENCIFDNRLAIAMAAILHKNNIQSVIIEGGSQTIQSFIDADLWDEARIFKSTKSFGNGVVSPKINSKFSIQKQTVLEDEFIKIYNYD